MKIKPKSKFDSSPQKRKWDKVTPSHARHRFACLIHGVGLWCLRIQWKPTTEVRSRIAGAAEEGFTIAPSPLLEWRGSYWLLNCVQAVVLTQPSCRRRFDSRLGLATFADRNVYLFHPWSENEKQNVELYATYCLQLDSKWKSWAMRDLQIDSGQKRRWKWNRKVNLILHKNANGIKLRPLLRDIDTAIRYSAIPGCRKYIARFRVVTSTFINT